MKTDANPDLLNALLDGTLDAAGESAALALLQRDAGARAEFARLAQLHTWLAADPVTQKSLAGLPGAAPRRILRFPRAWWVAAAVAAAVIALLATKLRPSAALEPVLPKPGMDALLAAQCSSCHESPAALVKASAQRLAPALPEAEAISRILERQLQQDTPCSRSVSEEARAALLQ